MENICQLQQVLARLIQGPNRRLQSGKFVRKSIYEDFVWKILYDDFVGKSLYEHFVWKSLYEHFV